MGWSYRHYTCHRPGYLFDPENEPAVIQSKTIRVEVMPERSAPINTTPYSEKELEHFKALLLQEQQEVTEEVDKLKESIGEIDDNEDDVSSSMDHHPGDIGTDEESKETDYILIERNLSKLKKINAALDRIDNGTYGVCEDTGKKISKERLEAIPYARLSMEAQKKYDDENPGKM